MSALEDVRLWSLLNNSVDVSEENAKEDVEETFGESQEDAESEVIKLLLVECRNIFIRSLENGSFSHFDHSDVY